MFTFPIGLFAANQTIATSLTANPSGVVPDEIWVYYTSGTVPTDLGSLSRSTYLRFTDYDSGSPLDLTALYAANGVGKYIFADLMTGGAEFIGLGELAIVSQVPSGIASASQEFCNDETNLPGSSTKSVRVLTVTAAGGAIVCAYNTPS